ncbi:MAG: AsmA-like C-terminal domain-containing protein, partial [Mariprofundaceae bacterium]|nr:AsmA-like C-terminal domain-containing protein [Mariprofundaceae bacterium]
WPMFAVQPDSGEAHLVPSPLWQTEIMGHAMQLSGGQMHWEAGKGLRFVGVDADYQGMKGNFDLQINDATTGELQVLGLRFDSNGDFSAIAKRLHMPMDGPMGSYAMSLRYNGQEKKSPWDFQLDLKQAGWSSLLGSEKKPGENYTLQANGSRTADRLVINRLQSSGVEPFVSGSGELSAERILIRIPALQAAAYSGALSIRIPLNDADEPLEIDMTSDFLDQRALPHQVPDIARKAVAPGKVESQRKWVLRGTFKRIHWDAVSIRGVEVHFASAEQGIGRLQADALDAAQFSMRDVNAFFQLGSGGRVDIRHLGAKAMGQQLKLSGTLHPEPGGGLRWTGFADINGDFSQVIQRLDASRLFKGGTVHALWSGSGVVYEDMPWWHAMQGRLRLRSDEGRILEGGTMTKLLAALSLADLPGFLTGNRKDISGPGMLYKRLQLEAMVQGENAEIRQLAMRASALDMAGKGNLNLSDGLIDLYVVVRPLQNVDALINMIPLLRDVILGPAKSVFRKVYRVHGPLHDAKVEAVRAEQAGLPD